MHQAAALRQRTICHYIVEAGASLMKTDLQVTAGAVAVGLSGATRGLARSRASKRAEQGCFGWGVCQSERS